MYVAFSVTTIYHVNLPLQSSPSPIITPDTILDYTTIYRYA